MLPKTSSSSPYLLSLDAHSQSRQHAANVNAELAVKVEFQRDARVVLAGRREPRHERAAATRDSAALLVHVK